MEGRFLSADRPTAWDHVIEPTHQRAEAKLRPSRADVRDWLQRGVNSMGTPGRIRLLYSHPKGPAVNEIRLLRDLAVEASSEQEWQVAVQRSGVSATSEWLGYGGATPRELFRRLELLHLPHEALAQLLVERAKVMAGSAGPTVLQRLRSDLLAAAKARAVLSAADMVGRILATGATIALPPTPLVRTDDVRGILFHIVASTSHVPAPRTLLMQEMPWSEREAADAIRSLCEEGLLAERPHALVLVAEMSPAPPPNLHVVLMPVLRRCLTLIRRSSSGPEQRDLARFGLVLVERLARERPEEVSAAFDPLDKAVKNLGDIFAVLRLGSLCVNAAERCLSVSPIVRKAHAQALVCAVSWAEQRTGDLVAARHHAEQSLELGQAIEWSRNTAFCRKCLGRILRMLGQQETDIEHRKRLFEESIEQLKLAITLFKNLDELTVEARKREVAACESLLARTMMCAGRMAEARRFADSASRGLGEGNDKDNVDVLILQGELADRDGSDPEKAWFFLSRAIDVSSQSWTYEVNEMRARALRARGRLQGPAIQDRIEDLRGAALLFEELGDERRSAAASLDIHRLKGEIPAKFDAVLRREPEYVALEALQTTLRPTPSSRRRR